MKDHLKHLLMCAPMPLVGLVLIAGGAGAGILIPLIASTVMMGPMGNGDRHSDSGPER